MRNLFNFIARQYFFFLFVLLQVVSFFMIIQNHNYHRSILVNSSSYLAGSVYEMRSNVAQYFQLKSINQRLAEENTMLLQQMPGAFLATDNKIFTFRDTLYQKQFSYINGRVINNSIRNRNNYLTLNKGRLHGIEPDMGVITPNGVVGIVKDVSANFSSVMSFLHSDMMISARLKNTNHIGTVIWEGYNYRKATMQYVPPHVEMSIGDTVVSSGFSHIFPEGILMGTISDYSVRRGDYFYTIDIDLAEDFASLEFVHIVQNHFKRELEELEAEQ